MKKGQVKTGQFRQGDVLIIKRNGALPAKMFSKKGSATLAFGEVTGHSHRVVAAKPSFVTSWTEADPNAGGVATLADAVELKKPGEVVHEEHGTIPLEAGTYDTFRQSEYSPEALRNVAD